MKQDKNIEKSTTHHPVNPACAFGINPVKKLILIKVTVTRTLYRRKRNGISDDRIGHRPVLFVGQIH